MNEMETKVFEKKALLIVNPVAGRKLIQRHVTQIVRDLMNQGYLVTTAVTGSRGEGRDLTRSLAAEYELLVCAGGDGTLNECVCGLLDAGLLVPIGYIPCGSTNDFAASHGLPTEIPAASRIAAGGRSQKYDVGCFSGRYFIHHALFGAFTWMAYSTPQDQKNKLGYGAYVLDGLRELMDLKPIHICMVTDETQLEGDFIFGAVSTDRHIAGLFDLPEDKIGLADGKLAAFLIVAPQNVQEWDALARSLITGDTNCPLIHILIGERFHVTSTEETEWSLDGEGSGPRKETDISVVPGFLELRG
jgi:YegS/Rv2252/BmrU family lipid kinase